MCYQPHMAEPSRRSSRLLIAAGALAALLLASGGFVLGRETAPVRTARSAPAPVAPEPAPETPLPTVQPPLGRADLLAAAALAADAYATARGTPEEVTALAGRAFELRLPIGCPGASPAADETVAYDVEEEALRVRKEPVRWSANEWLPRPAENGDGTAAAEVEAVEGFVVPFPWLLSEICPARPASAAPVAPIDQAKAPAVASAPLVAPPPVAASGRRLALGEFFLPGGSRVGRRDGEAYRAVERIAPDALNIGQGLRLRLRGRVARSPAGPTILCRGPATSPPDCLFSVRFDQVAFENPVDGATLATWDVSSQRPGTGE